MIRISVSKKLNLPYGETELVVDEELPLNQICALYGRSGAGKTSLLNILAGIITPEKGYIEVNGKVWLDTKKHINLPPQKREAGFVFQDYALFPNMTVKQNLLYAAGSKTDTAQADDLLQITGLTAFADHKPATLSGGQKQRAALARALIRKPSLLLLDEPLSAVDAGARSNLQQQLLNLRQEYNFTGVLVTHDTDEIIMLAKKVLCIDNGRIIQTGPPAEVLGTKPANNKLVLEGTVIAMNGEELDVMVGKQLIKIRQTYLCKVGDSISVSFEQAAQVKPDSSVME